MANKNHAPNGQFTPGNLVRTVRGLEDLSDEQWPLTIDRQPKKKGTGREVLDSVMEDLRDVKVSERVQRESEVQRRDEEARRVIGDPNASEEQKEQARAYQAARQEEILRRNAMDRGLREMAKQGAQDSAATDGQMPSHPDGQKGEDKSFREQVGRTLGNFFKSAQSARNSAPVNKTGDIDVSATTYTQNGKVIHRKAHKRKRS